MTKSPKQLTIRTLVLLSIGVSAIIMGSVVLYRKAHPTGLFPTQFIQTQGAISHLQYLPDGRLEVTTGDSPASSTVEFRDAKTGTLVQSWAGGQSLSESHKWFSKDGTRLIETTRSMDGPTYCILRDAKSGRMLRQWMGKVGDVLPDFSMMVMADDTKKILSTSKSANPPWTYIEPKAGRLVDVETGKVIRTFPLSPGSMYQARFSRTQPLLCLPSYKEPSQILRVPSMTPLITSLVPLSSLRVSRDSTRAFGVNDVGVLHLWRLPSGDHTQIETGLLQAYWVSATPSGLIVVSGRIGDKLHQHEVQQVWSADGTQLLYTLPGDARGYSPDGRLFACPASANFAETDRYDIWNYETGKHIATLNTGTDALGNPRRQDFVPFAWIAIASDGRQVAYGSQDGLLLFYDLTKTPEPNLHALISTNAGTTIGTVSTESTDQDLLDIISQTHGAPISFDDLKGHAAFQNSVLPRQQTRNNRVYVLSSVTRSPDKKQLAVLWNGIATVMDHGKPEITSTTSGMLELRDAKTGNILRTLTSAVRDEHDYNGHGAIGSVAFSSDGTQLAVANDRGIIEVWDTVTGHKTHHLSGTKMTSRGSTVAFAESTAYSARLAFSPDGQFLAAARYDGSLYLYSLKTNLPVAQIGQLEPSAFASPSDTTALMRWIAFSRDGHTLYGMTQASNEIRAWNVPTVL